MGKKVLIFALCFITIISCLQVLTNHDSFNLKTYINNLSQFTRPELPSLTFDGTDYSVLEYREVEYNGTRTYEPIGFFEQAGAFFTFVGECIAYPILLLTYYILVITTFFGGMVF